MTEARHKIWTKKVASSVGGSPKLKTLPPTDDACKQNVARAHLQVAIWRQDLVPDLQRWIPADTDGVKRKGIILCGQ